MKTSRMVVLFAVLVLSNVCLSQNLVPNGGFENDFAGWTPQGTAAISTSVVKAGSKALMAVNPDTTEYSYAWQALDLEFDVHEINFWVYPESATYFSTFELLEGWMDAAPDVFINRVQFKHNSIDFYAVEGGSPPLSNPLIANSWNKVTIQVNKANLKQDFFVNDNFMYSLTSSSLPAVQHLLVGDLSATGHFGTVFFDEISITPFLTVSISEPGPIPPEFELDQNYPNPFNPETTISYHTAQNGPVVLKIYNMVGQEVKTLVDKKQLAGKYSVAWDGTDKGGQKVSSGVYFYRLESNGFVKTRKMLAIK